MQDIFKLAGVFTNYLEVIKRGVVFGKTWYSCYQTY